MQKSKLGISIGLLGAALYFSGLFGGYIITIILAGYVLLMEDNPWIRRTSVKAVTLLMSFSIMFELLNIIPNIISVINRICNIFGGQFSIEFFTKIVYALQSALNFTEVLLLLVLGFKAITQGTIIISVIDNFISKHME